MTYQIYFFFCEATPTMATQFAKPSFLGGIDEKLATVDTYARTLKSSINNVKSIDSKVQSALEGAKLATSTRNFVELTDEDKGIGPASVTDKLSKLKPLISKGADMLGTITALIGPIQSQISTATGLYGKAVAEVNGIKRIVSGKDLKSLSGLSRAIGQLSSNNFPLTLSDSATMIGVKTAMISNAISTGLPGAFTALTNGIDDVKERVGIVKGVTSSIVKNSDLYSLAEVANSQTCSHLMVSQTPNVLKDFAAGFKLPAGLASKDLKVIGNTLADTYDKLDSTWKTASRGGNVVRSLKIIDKASTDFKSAFRASDSSDELDMVLGNGSTPDVVNTLKLSKVTTTTATPRSSQPSGSALLDSLPMGSIKTLPAGTKPVNNLFNKWTELGIKDSWMVYVNMYGFGSPEYVKVNAYGVSIT